MRNLKKVLALVLTLAMMLSVMVMNTGAAFSDQSDIDTKHTEAVDNCVALSIINGYDNKDGTFSFKPNGDVTRAQMAKMICIAVNGGKEPMGGSSSAATFSDVPTSHWAFKYVEYCFSSKYIDGTKSPVIDANNNVTEQGTFSPDKQVTGSQAAKMLLTALGYDSVKEGFTGSAWEVNVNTKASSVGLYENLEDIDASAPLSREHAAEMIWNALNANTVSYNKDTGKAEKETKSAQSEWYGTEDSIFVLHNIEFDSDKGKYTYSGYVYDTNKNELATDTDKGGALVESKDFTSTEDYSALYGQVVKAMADGTDLTGLAAEKSKVIVEGVIGDIDSVKNSDTKFKIDGTEYKLDTDKSNNIQLYVFNAYNGEDLHINSLSDLPGWTSFKAIDNNDNGKIDTLVLFPVTVDQVKSVSKSTVKMENDTASYDIDDDDIYDGIAKEDWVVITKADNNATDNAVVAQAEVISGEVSSDKGSISGGDYKVKIDGTWYKASGEGNTATKAPLTQGQEYELVVYNGYYFDVAQVSGDTNVAVLTGIGDYNKTDKTLEVTLLLEDGSEQDVTVEALYMHGMKLDETYLKVLTSTSSEEIAMIEIMGLPVAYEDNGGVFTLRFMDDIDDGAPVVADPEKTSDYVNFDLYDSDVKYKSDDGCIYVDGTAYEIVDDTIFFVCTVDEPAGRGVIPDVKWTVLTGDEMLDKNDISFDDEGFLVHDGSDIGAMFLYTDNSISSGDEVYAYVTDTNYAKDSDNNKSVLYLDMIIDGEVLTGVETNVTTRGAISADTVISYVMNDEGVIVDWDLVDMTKDIVDSHNAKMVTFLNWGRFTVDKDTVVIAIDSSDDDDIQYVDAEVRDAEDDAEKANAMFYSEDGKVLDLIIIEVDSDCDFGAPTLRSAPI